MAHHAAAMKAFEDPDHEGNSARYHTGFPCVEKGCDRPAGTAWSPYWCFEHNVERIHRITGQIETVIGQLEREQESTTNQDGNETL